MLPSISNLMSPPEAKPLDTFHLTPSKSPQSGTERSEYTSHIKLPPMASPAQECTTRILPSPPVSPWMKKRKAEDSSCIEAVTAEDDYNPDPILFPRSLESDDRPLFPAEPLKATDDLIEQKITMHLLQFKNRLSKPTREEYRLCLECVPTIGALYNRNPAAYVKRQRSEMEAEHRGVKRHHLPQKDRAALVPIAPASRAGKRAIKPVLAKASLPKLQRTPKLSPMAKLMNYPVKGRSSETPERMPGAKRDDVDYDALPDYAPDTSTLSDQPKSLKADWPSSNVLDLSQDPDRHMLHEAEIGLAATLRLTCATYICSKRRIFEARLTALKIGKEFRKTDAQQACKIDVNKASKLWTAYDRVGWLRPEHLQHWLN